MLEVELFLTHSVGFSIIFCHSVKWEVLEVEIRYLGEEKSHGK